jgi:uncharacterized Fe-S cluster protein YjdI
MSGKLQSYSSDHITVTFDPTVCTHAARCVKGLPAVFDVKRRPWIDPTADSADAIEAQVRRCPSGALQCTRHDGDAERRD